MRRMPRQKPGNSKQCYRTPEEFLKSIETRFGPITFDLAATDKNAVCDAYFTKKQNALSPKTLWPRSGNLWLNPPFFRIKDWVKRVYEHSRKLDKGGRVLVLLPGGVGTDWFWSWVWNKSNVEVLKPRLSFSKKGSYPKELILCIYPKTIQLPLFDRWAWKVALNEGTHRKHKTDVPILPRTVVQLDEYNSLQKVGRRRAR